jgi:hypothetical protein
MTSKTFRIARMIVLASFALSSAAGATCSNASLVVPTGFCTTAQIATAALAAPRHP